jgi:chloramphenicol 3-O-phosphotransferase
MGGVIGAQAESAAASFITPMNIDRAMAGAVIVLNGASSSGKSSLSRRMQALIDLAFLLVSADQLIEARGAPECCTCR